HLALTRVDAARAYDDSMLRQDLGRKPAHFRQLSRASSQQSRQRHSMYVARRSGIGSIDVRVCVQPDDTDLLSPASVECSHAGRATNRNRVIAAQYDGQCALIQGILDHALQFNGRGCNLGKKAGFVVGLSNGFGRIDVNVAGIADFITEPRYGLVQAGYPDDRGSHIDSAPACAEVHRNPYDPYLFLHRVALL